MKKYIIPFIILLTILITIPIVLIAQDNNQDQISIRTLSIDWYMYSSKGVKLQYRTFSNDPVILYLPASMKNKFFRFIEAPKGSGSTQGLPVLLVHLKGKEVTFIDIYTLYQRKNGLIANFTSEDIKKLKEAQNLKKIDIKF